MKKLSMLIGVLILVTLNVLAGTESSGGGGAAVCRDTNRKILSARILDLYEGEVRFGYLIPQSLEDSRQQLLDALAKIPSQVGQQLVRQAASEVLNSVVFLPLGVGLAPTTDLGSEYGVVVPDGCAIEPVGFYETDGTLKVSRSVFKALSGTDQAAFFLHESVYKVARNTSQQKDSAASRQLVAALFSQSENADSIEALMSKILYNYNRWSPSQLNPIILTGPNADFKMRFTTVDPNSNPSIENPMIVALQCLDAGPIYVDNSFEGLGVLERNFRDINLNHPCSSLSIMAYYKYGPYLPNVSVGSYEIFDANGKLLTSGAVPQYGNWWPIPLLRTYVTIPQFPVL